MNIELMNNAIAALGFGNISLNNNSMYTKNIAGVVTFEM